MRPTNFAYWLQGYFELSNNQIPVDLNTWLDCVNMHLDLVFLGFAERGRKASTKELEFLVGIRRAIATCKEEGNLNPIQAVLAAFFIHVIDPNQYDEDTLADQVHSKPNGKPSSKPDKFRC